MVRVGTFDLISQILCNACVQLKLKYRATAKAKTLGRNEWRMQRNAQ